MQNIQIYAEYRTFSFVWHNQLTHDHLNYASLMDGHLLDHVKSLETSGYLNKTLLIIMADHGSRWGVLWWPSGYAVRLAFCYIGFETYSLNIEKIYLYTFWISTNMIYFNRFGGVRSTHQGKDYRKNGFRC